MDQQAGRMIVAGDNVDPIGQDLVDTVLDCSALPIEPVHGWLVATVTYAKQAVRVASEAQAAPDVGVRIGEELLADGILDEVVLVDCVPAVLVFLGDEQRLVVRIEVERPKFGT